MWDRVLQPGVPGAPTSSAQHRTMAHNLGAQIRNLTIKLESCVLTDYDAFFKEVNEAVDTLAAKYAKPEEESVPKPAVVCAVPADIPPGLRLVTIVVRSKRFWHSEGGLLFDDCFHDLFMGFPLHWLIT